MSMPRTDAGFSLLEMLVAVAVFSLAAIALLNLAGENTRATWRIEEAVLAGIVADNRAVEAMLVPPEALLARQEGVERLGDRDLRWQRESHPVPEAGVQRVHIRVSLDGSGQTLAELSVLREAP